MHGGRMNKRSYIRRNRFKERNIKNEVIRIDNARINKLIENKKNSAKSIKCYIRMLVVATVVYIVLYVCLFYVQGIYKDLIIGVIFPFLFGAFFYFISEIDRYNKEISECDNEIFNLGKELYVNGNLDECNLAEFKKQIK